MSFFISIGEWREGGGGEEGGDLLLRGNSLFDV